MAEKYELVITTDGSSGNSKTETRSSKDSSGGASIFKRSKTRKSSHGIDILATLKEKLGDVAKNRTYDRVYAKQMAGGASEELAKKAASKAGSQAAGAAALGIVALTVTAGKAANTVLSNVGNWTSNQAYQNKVDNIRGIGGKTAGVIGTIGAGAALGGWIGALIAALSAGVNMAMDMGKQAIEISKNQIINDADTERARDRLGYIDTGRSR